MFRSEHQRPITLAPIVDSGAEVSLIDGSEALHAGWTMDDIIDGARGSRPILGIGAGPPIMGYLHNVTCYVGTSSLFAQLNIGVYVTKSNAIRESVRGRDDFFRKTDVTFSETDRLIRLRFRDTQVIKGL
jgi:hypothetical protein